MGVPKKSEKIPDFLKKKSKKMWGYIKKMKKVQIFWKKIEKNSGGTKKNLGGHKFLWKVQRISLTIKKYHNKEQILNMFKSVQIWLRSNMVAFKYGCVQI